MNSPYIAQELWSQLWQIYRQRVTYARIYEKMIRDAGGVLANDHIAFRSLRLVVDSPTGAINLGIPYLETIVKWLGYESAGEYTFRAPRSGSLRDRNLYARHYRHPQQDKFDLPKLFISELIVDQLPNSIAKSIHNTVESGSFFDFSALQKLASDSVPNYPEVVKALIPAFTCPWSPAKHSVIEAVNEVSQYGSWVLLHGYGVNHFTAYINKQNATIYPDIETAAQALASQGVPMKDRIEGSQSTGLQQTATQAIVESVAVLDEEGNIIQIPWSYAYYELAQRYLVSDDTGRKNLFQGFIAPQAQNLFEMTNTL